MNQNFEKGSKLKKKIEDEKTSKHSDNVDKIWLKSVWSMIIKLSVGTDGNMMRQLFNRR